MYARQMLKHVADWLGDQDEHLSSGLKNAFDGLRLYDYAQSHADTLGEYADEWEPEHRIAALGYDPLYDSAAAGIFREPEHTGAAVAVQAMTAAVKLLDSVAYVHDDGDTEQPLADLREVLTYQPQPMPEKAPLQWREL